MRPSSEEAFLSAIAETPEDLTPRLVYADWLEEQGDPRADYLRGRCQMLRSLTTGEGAASPRQQAEGVERSFDPDWLKFVETQDRLYRVSRRCGGVRTPPALRVLWREAVRDAAPGARFYGLSVAGRASRWEIVLETEHELEDNRAVYLERNPQIQHAFLRMFGQIDFMGVDSTGGSFGFWRYAEGVTMANAPVLYLDTDCQFRVCGATLQDYFAEGLKNFVAVRHWFAERGVATSRSLKAIYNSVKHFPDPQQRFDEYCRGG